MPVLSRPVTPVALPVPIPAVSPEVVVFQKLLDVAPPRRSPINPPRCAPVAALVTLPVA